jgi:hypothetical protein
LTAIAGEIKVFVLLFVLRFVAEQLWLIAGQASTETVFESGRKKRVTSKVMAIG